jgi:hypothetical protein
VIINTIYHGPCDHSMDCGNDRSMSANYDGVAVDIPTLYDEDMVKLPDELNGAYVAFASGVGNSGGSLCQRCSIDLSAPVGVDRAGKTAFNQLGSWLMAFLPQHVLQLTPA